MIVWPNLIADIHDRRSKLDTKCKKAEGRTYFRRRGLEAMSGIGRVEDGVAR